MGLEWLIIVIIISVGVTLAVLWPHIMVWLEKSPPPPNIDPPEPPDEQHAPTSPPVAPSVKKDPEYLGNSNTKEIHDLSNIKPACHIDLINEENKVFFDNIEEAKKAMESKGYDGCRWCLSQYHTD